MKFWIIRSVRGSDLLSDGRLKVLREAGSVWPPTTTRQLHPLYGLACPVRRPTDRSIEGLPLALLLVFVWSELQRSHSRALPLRRLKCMLSNPAFQMACLEATFSRGRVINDRVEPARPRLLSLRKSQQQQLAVSCIVVETTECQTRLSSTLAMM